jgi:hypothetical protein
MEPYRERLTPPAAWWIVAPLFGASCGWIMVVASTPVIGAVAGIVATAIVGALVAAYGSLTLVADPQGLRVGSAHLSREFIGAVTPLDRAAFRRYLGPGADARAWLRTRPYVDSGIRVDVDDPSDPVPYWLVSSRHPEAVAAALGQQVGHTGDSDQAAGQRRDDGG